MKRKWLYLIAAAAIVLSMTAVKPAIAYFTDTMTAEGTIPIKITDSTTKIKEKVSEMTKHVVISNTGDYDIFVRAKAIAPDSCTITPTLNEGWSKGDGEYYYYNKPLAPGEETATELELKISNDSNLDFNVVVVQEAVKALYNADGSAQPIDWSTGKISTSNEATIPAAETETTPEAETAPENAETPENGEQQPEAPVVEESEETVQ